MNLIKSFDLKSGKNEQFKIIDCKCFSYNFFTNMIGFSMNLKKCINLRFAITTDKRLTYPKRISSYIKNRNSYYSIDGYPAIGFSFGRSINNNWYLFILQSDLIAHSPSFIRDHFRGWRKVLFYNIISYSKTKGIKKIYLNSPEGVNKCYNNCIKRDESLYKVLENIYRKTAIEFDMNYVRLEDAIDIQIFPDLCDIKTHYFYELRTDKNVYFKKKQIFQ